MKFTTTDLILIISFSMLFLLACVTIVCVMRIASRFLNLKESRLSKEIELTDNALQALDQLINSALEEYRLLTLTPKEIFYINNALETEIIKDLTDLIPGMISPLLLTKLGYMYHPNYVPSLIGTRIYLAVLNFVLEFNTENSALLQEENKK